MNKKGIAQQIMFYARFVFGALVFLMLAYAWFVLSKAPASAKLDPVQGNQIRLANALADATSPGCKKLPMQSSDYILTLLIEDDVAKLVLEEEGKSPAKLPVKGVTADCNKGLCVEKTSSTGTMPANTPITICNQNNRLSISIT